MNQDKHDLIKAISILLSKIKEVRSKRKWNFDPALFICQTMNDIADKEFLQQMFDKIENHLKLEEKWLEDEKIINLDDFRS